MFTCYILLFYWFYMILYHTLSYIIYICWNIFNDTFHSDSDLDESATFSDSQIDYNRRLETRGKSAGPQEEHGYNLRSNKGKRPLSGKRHDKRALSKRPTGRKQRSVLIAAPYSKPNRKVRGNSGLEVYEFTRACSFALAHISN